jgi:hypothetical protein
VNDLTIGKFYTLGERSTIGIGKRSRLQQIKKRLTVMVDIDISGAAAAADNSLPLPHKTKHIVPGREREKES